MGILGVLNKCLLTYQATTMTADNLSYPNSYKFFQIIDTTQSMICVSNKLCQSILLSEPL